MMPVRDICALVFAALLIVAVVGAGFALRERQLNPRDMTDLSSSHHRGNWE